MKVAIDSGPLTGGHSVRGIGMMVRELITALENLGTKELKNVKIEAVDFGETNLSKYDLVHYLYLYPYTLTLPARKPTKKAIVTMHDLIQLIYPKQFPPGFRGKINFYRQLHRLKYVDAVLAVSETSKKDIVRFLGINPEKVHVVYLAAKKVYKKIENRDYLASVASKYKLPEKFALYVGDVNYNKNIPNLIKACSSAKIPLVICGKQAKEVDNEGMGLNTLRGPRDYLRFLMGKPHPELAHYQTLKRIFENERHVIRLGFVQDSDLAAIYNLATVYIQPSFYEGFGLPVLEAMACGTPVIISKTNALVEIAGNAALVVDANSYKNMAEAISEIIKNTTLRVDLIKKGFERVRQFSWEKCARETLEVYKKVVNS